jgi:hypothetical protein
VPFVDTRDNRREGRVWLKPVRAVTTGVPFGRLINSRFQWVTPNGRPHAVERLRWGHVAAP